jgi:hypothetical protein
VSVEATSWALNQAPVPDDRGHDRQSAKAVKAIALPMCALPKWEVAKWPTDSRPTVMARPSWIPCEVATHIQPPVRCR